MLSHIRACILNDDASRAVCVAKFLRAEGIVLLSSRGGYREDPHPRGSVRSVLRVCYGAHVRAFFMPREIRRRSGDRRFLSVSSARSRERHVALFSFFRWKSILAGRATAAVAAAVASNDDVPRYLNFSCRLNFCAIVSAFRQVARQPRYLLTCIILIIVT